MEDSQEVTQSIRQQIAVMEAFANISRKCFSKCVFRPTRQLSSSEDLCLTNCVDRYRDTQVFLIERLQNKALEEQNSGVSSNNYY